MLTLGVLVGCLVILLSLSILFLILGRKDYKENSNNIGLLWFSFLSFAGAVFVFNFLTEANQRKLFTAQPPPQFEFSLERENLIKKLNLMNSQNKIFYIYCLGLNGNVIYYGMVKGKVSSLNSLLTTPEQLIRDNSGSSISVHRMPSPDFDGSYGSNPQGVFWFDPADMYHEWTGTYYLSQVPERINTPISITTTIDLEKKGNK